MAEQQAEMERKSSEVDYDDLGEVELLTDIGMVEFFTEEHKRIKRILNLKNTTKDKLSYMLFALNIFFTCFLIGYRPNYFYLWHTIKAIVLVSYRWYSYKKLKYHYFLFDFCYFTNLLVLLYLWLPEWVLGPVLRGRLFTTCFCFASGPVMIAIVLWKNALVPHSNDKMTSLFIHISPTLALFGLRWYSTPDQRFPLCSVQKDFDISTCSEVPGSEIHHYPMLMYCVWQILYILVVEVILKKRVEKRDYATSYKYLVNKSRTSFFVKIFSIFGPSYRKAVFIAWQFFYSVFVINLTYFCYMYKEVHMVAVVIVMAFASYNGASFYIDVFSHKYSSSQSKSD